MNERVHDQTIAAIEALFRGKLSPERVREVSVHVAECERCERVYQRYADAEQAMFKGAAFTPYAEERVGARLFGREPPAPSAKPKIFAALAAAAAVVFAAIVFVPGGRTSNEFGARGDGQKTLAPESRLRVLALQKQGEIVGVVDLGTGDKALYRGDRLKLLADTSSEQRYASAVIAAGGKVIAEVAPLPIGPNATDAPISSTMPVDDTWPEGQVKIVLLLSPEARRADPAARAGDNGAESVRVLELRVEGLRLP